MRRIFPLRFLLRLMQGVLIGLGAVLPGASGGVLCVAFGLYRPIMALLADPPGKWRESLPTLLPAALGGALGFLGVARLLAALLESHPAPALCIFAGLIAGMLPSLFREAGQHGRRRGALLIALIATLALLILLRALQLRIRPGIFAYLFCGLCLALSLIVPGLSFSTLLMPLGLYEPLVAGIGALDMAVILPSGIGALAAILLLSRAVNRLFARHPAPAQHAVIGVVIAATAMTIPLAAIISSWQSCLILLLCTALGFVLALLLDEFNKKDPGR